ncbi:hypothetical protein HOLleu_12355 [Holothuria leucospilota]|uniref:Uncharacterized protein n=1 Tax=Holothuria leucospilota TaxID=206669 RepID=A0A9Q1HDQ5_HOLLE|nr:hypothetical protein HOLleu_12355 [Holothuria leucospilota]
MGRDINETRLSHCRDIIKLHRAQTLLRSYSLTESPEASPCGKLPYAVSTLCIEIVIIHHRLALSLFARGTSSYATARCRSTTVPSSTCMHYQPLDQTRQILIKEL